MKKYTQPQLNHMGPFSDLTRGPVGSTNDGVGGGAGKAGSSEGKGK